MNSELQGEHAVAIALQGRVPCKVLGKVEKGDIIVSSAIEGYGIVQNDPVVGTVIGKAVGTKDDDDGNDDGQDDDNDGIVIIINQ